MTHPEASPPDKKQNDDELESLVVKLKEAGDSIRKSGAEFRREFHGIRGNPKPGRPEKHPLLPFLWRKITSFTETVIIEPVGFIWQAVTEFMEYHVDVPGRLGYWYCSGCEEYHGPRTKYRSFLFAGKYCSLWWKDKEKGADK